MSVQTVRQRQPSTPGPSFERFVKEGEPDPGGCAADRRPTAAEKLQPPCRNRMETSFSSVISSTA